MNFSKAALALTATLVLVAPVVRAEPVGFVTKIRGLVELDGQAVQKTTPVNAGSVVETKYGKATLLLGKNQVVHLDVNTRFELTKVLAAETELQMPYGRARAMVRSDGAKKSFKIRSRSAVMGVRGTHIYLDSPRDPRLPQTFATLDGEATLEFTKPAGPAPGAPKEPGKTEAGKAPVPGTASAPGTPPPPEGKPEIKTILLSKNESVQTGSGGPENRPGLQPVVHLPPERAHALSDGIAPPPKVPLTPGDKQPPGEAPRRPAPKGGGADPSGGLGDPEQDQRPPLPPIATLPPVLDPNLPVSIPVSVIVNGKKQ